MKKNLAVSVIALLLFAFSSSANAHTINDTMCDKTVVGVYHHLKTTHPPGSYLPVGSGGAVKNFEVVSTELFYTFKERWTNYVCTSTIKVTMENGT
jgi:hypothetical protein